MRLLGWRPVALFLGIFVLVYAPVLVTPYAFMDDYALLASRVQADSWERGQENAQMIASGRPILALLVDVTYRFLADIAALRALRLLGVIGVALLAWSFLRQCLLAGWPYSPSFSLTLTVFTLPPFQVYTSWAVMAFMPFAALLAGGAFGLTTQSFEEQPLWRKLLLASAAVFLLLAALAIYQPAAMFFCVFATVSLFKPDTPLPSLWRWGWWCGLILSCSCLAAFAVSQIGVALYEKELLLPPRASLTVDLLGKMSWFFREPLACALHLLSLFPHRWSSVTISMFIVGGMLLYFQGTMIERFGKLLLAFFVIFVSYLPNLVAAESWAAYRTQVALTSLIAVYAFFALSGYSQVLQRKTLTLALPLILSGVALASIFCAAHNVYAYFARPQILELEWLRAQLTRENLAQASGIYIIRPTQKNTLGPTWRYDEFGFPSTAAAWVPKALAYLLVREIDPERVTMAIEALSAEEVRTFPLQALVIDMRQMSSVDLVRR